MPWPIPQPGEISSRAAGVYEAALPGIDARSPNRVATVNCRVTDMAMSDLYLYQGTLAEELMPDTAVLYLSRHGAIWGVPQDQATVSNGNLLLTTGATTSAEVPANLQFSAAGNVLVMSTEAVTIAANTTGSVPVISVGTGTAQNLPPGTPFTPAEPIPGLAAQSATVDSNGLTGGLDLESAESWRQRILARIRQPPQAGSQSDYEQWVKDALPGVGYVTILPNWTGPGNVGVVFALSGPTLPTAAQIATVLSYINTVRPVTANVIVMAPTLVPVNYSLLMNPNTAAVQAAGAQALALAMQSDATIGGTIYMSRMDDALSSGSGEYSHERRAPTADVVAAPTQLLTLGAITWETS